MKYNVEITEYLTRVVEVEAENEKDAENKVWDQYINEEIVLDSEDCSGFSIETLE